MVQPATKRLVTEATLPELAQDAFASMFRAGTNVTFTYDDAANTFTINASGGGAGTTDPEIVRDTIGGALVGGANIQVTVNDAADSITVAVTGLATVATSGSYTDLISTLGTASNPVTNASAARPTGIPKVFWQCSTQPTNWVAGDEWINNA